MFKTAYGYTSELRRVSYETTGETRTVQSEKKNSDINYIMEKYQKTGLVSHVATHHGRYGDFSNPVDYMTALNVVIAAEEMFSSLPASIRKKFDNDPHQFLEFTTNPDNFDEMVELGLVKNTTPPAAVQREEKAAPKEEDLSPAPKSQRLKASDKNS
ncbi:putative minor capsid protein [Eel River basin pequenovirus]|nr:putative minor capsid protein [Eel River basin pequenovirus]